MLNKNMKAWTTPEILSIEPMKNAAGGSGTGVAKGPGDTEFQFDGPGS